MIFEKIHHSWLFQRLHCSRTWILFHEYSFSVIPRYKLLNTNRKIGCPAASQVPESESWIQSCSETATCNYWTTLLAQSQPYPEGHSPSTSCSFYLNCFYLFISCSFLSSNYYLYPSKVQIQIPYICIDKQQRGKKQQYFK